MDTESAIPPERVVIGAFKLFEIVGCSVTGESHLARSRLGDDAFGMAEDADRIAVVACDGAGAATDGGRGANFIAQMLPDRLLERWARADDGAFSEESVQEAVVHSLTELRGELETRAQSNGKALVDFNTTVVGLVGQGELGMLFQIGDGAGGCFARTPDNPDDWSEVRILPPDNGEYVNETSFLTSENWRKKLRFSPAAAFEAALLVTDGATPFALARAQASFDPAFARGLLKFMASHPAEVAAPSLRNLLVRPEALRASDDDKTLVCIRRRPPDAPATSETRGAAEPPPG